MRGRWRLLPMPGQPLGNLSPVQPAEARWAHVSVPPARRAARSHLLAPHPPAGPPSSAAAMACLAFGRATLLSHPSFGDKRLDDVEWQQQLIVQVCARVWLPRSLQVAACLLQPL